MNNEIKTADIIKNLRMCADINESCDGCIYRNRKRCVHNLMWVAAYQLEKLENTTGQSITTISENTEDYVPVTQQVGNPMPPDKVEALKARIMASRDADRQSMERAIMQRAVDTYGREKQTDVAIEEMAELTEAITVKHMTRLTKALQKTRRVLGDDHAAQEHARNSVIEEIADVEIMIDQLKIMYGEHCVNTVREQKLVRLEGRLNEQCTEAGVTT